MERLTSIGLVALGGAIGSVLRYLMALLAIARGWISFPWATLVVNVVGSFCIMVVVTLAASRAMAPNLRLFLATGIMGGLTTYSTFDAETTKLFQDGATATAVLNILVTLVACFLAGLLGLALARAIASD